MAVEVGAVPLNDRPMRREDYRDLRGRLATPALQKLLNLSVGGIAFLAHQALGPFDIARGTPDEDLGDLGDFGLIQSGFYRLLVRRFGGLGALAGRPVIVEDLLCVVAGFLGFLLMELLLLPQRVGIVRQLRLRVNRPHELPGPEQVLDKQALRLGVITANVWQRRCAHLLDRFCRIYQIQQT
jgi:hypothetical protein